MALCRVVSEKCQPLSFTLDLFVLSAELKDATRWDVKIRPQVTLPRTVTWQSATILQIQHGRRPP